MSSMNWKPLPAFDNFPALLARPDFTSQSYSLYVTDLANIWVEALDRKGIGKRSLNEDTSIDPTEGPDQMVLLLNKIQAALDPSAPDHHHTSVSLTTSPQVGEDGLALSITCHLPDGLPPLKWTFQLAKSPSTSIASELVLPLIQAQHYRSRQVADLINNLKEKDHVIEKLVDKLDSAGISLDNVFNTLSGSRKPSRETAAKKVKGLALFKESEWRSTQLQSSETPDNVTSLVEDVFSDSFHYEDLEISPADSLGHWWQSLGPRPITGTRPEQEKRDVKTSKDAHAGIISEETRPVAERDNDFQVQATPPQTDSARRGRTVVDIDATTDDEAEAIPDSHPTPVQPVKTRLGTAGMKRSIEPASVRQSSREAAAAADDTVSESDDEPAKSPPRHRKGGHLGKIEKTIRPARSEAEESPPVTQTAQKDSTPTGSDEKPPITSTSPETSSERHVPKKKLGTIGRIGKMSRQTSVPQESGSKLPEVVTARPVARRIGAIGKRKAEERRPDSQASSQVVDDEETGEQRAERKRAELARELEQKAATKPVKKKRKF